MELTSIMSELPGHLKTEVTSREGARFLNSVCNVLHDTGSEEIFGVQVQPIGAFVKTVDDSWYLPKTVDNTPKAWNSGSKFVGECQMLVGGEGKGSAASVGMSFLDLVYNTFKLAGAFFASMKFLGKSGVTFLTSHVKKLGIWKNALSTYCAVHDLAKNVRDLIDTSLTEGKDKAKDLALRSIAILGYLSSLCLNGFGALQTIYGSELSKAGQAVMPPFGWNVLNLVGSTGALLVKTISKLA